MYARLFSGIATATMAAALIAAPATAHADCGDDIQPAPDNFAGATVAAPKNWPYPSVPPEPIVLVDQGGHWLVTHDAAMVFLNKMWSTSRHRFVPFI
ncbi:hypothetical protein [Mycobacterium sp.]|uniref:hypothetical protein n=2 Tax=Mycobacterium sp. TaxID=1785 RepID=UPI0031D5D1DF